MEYQKQLTKPIFLCGLGHSGTSLTKNLLDWHPDLYVVPPNELHFFRNLDYVNLRVGFSQMYQNKIMTKSDYEKDIKKNLEYFCNEVYINRRNKDSGFDLESFKKNLMDSNPQNDKELLICLMKEMANATLDFDKTRIDKARYVFKSTFDEEYLLELLNWFPDMKIVYIFRNPYGCWVSTKRNRLKNKSIISFHSMLLNMRVSYYWLYKFKKLYPDQVYVLLYDKLLKNTKPEIESLCEFLDIEYHDSLLNQTLMGKEIKGHTSWGDFSQSEVIQKPLHQWKNDITPYEINLLNRKFWKIFQDYDFDYQERKLSIWNFAKRIKGENFQTYFLNRLAYFLNSF